MKIPGNVFHDASRPETPCRKDLPKANSVNFATDFRDLRPATQSPAEPREPVQIRTRDVRDISPPRLHESIRSRPLPRSRESPELSAQEDPT